MKFKLPIIVPLSVEGYGEGEYNVFISHASSNKEKDKREVIFGLSTKGFKKIKILKRVLLSDVKKFIEENAS